MRVGMLTGGGDCPGLNAVIRATTRRLAGNGHEVVGVLHGWRGMIEGRFMRLGDRRRVGDPAARRHDPEDQPHEPIPRGGRRRRRAPQPGGFDALIAIGGEDTLGVAHRIHDEHGAPIIGVPKTIDNDLAATDQTFGFDTAVSIATEAIDRLHTTAESHDRVMVVEVMGRHAGWLARPERHRRRRGRHPDPGAPVSRRALRRDDARAAHARGRDFSIVVVAEGWPMTHEDGQRGLATQTEELDAFGHVRLGGIGDRLGAGDRAADRLRDARHGARPRPARRLADRIRPRARDALRPARRRPGARRAASA